MRTAIATCALLAAVVVAPAAEDAKSAFITTADGLKIHYLELKGAQIVIVRGETHGSVHLNPTYTSTLVKFIDAHSR